MDQNDSTTKPGYSITCRKCGSIAKAGTILCPQCKTSFRPVILTVLCVLNFVSLFLALCFGVINQTWEDLTLWRDGLFLGCVLVTLLLTWGVFKGKYIAWYCIQFWYGLRAVIMVSGGIWELTAIGSRADPAGVVRSMFGAILVYGLFLSYFHTPRVKQFCSAGKAYKPTKGKKAHDSQ